MRISDWSSDVCSSDLQIAEIEERRAAEGEFPVQNGGDLPPGAHPPHQDVRAAEIGVREARRTGPGVEQAALGLGEGDERAGQVRSQARSAPAVDQDRKSTRLNSSH